MNNTDKNIISKFRNNEVVQTKKGYVVRIKCLWFYLYAGYDFCGMYGWGFGKEYFKTLEEAVRVSKNFGIN